MRESFKFLYFVLRCASSWYEPDNSFVEGVFCGGDLKNLKVFDRRGEMKLSELLPPRQ